MGAHQTQWSPTLLDRSWTGVSLLGFLLLLVPLYDIWDDTANLSWDIATSLLENSVLIVLSLGLVYGGLWLSQRDWEPEYKWTVTKWNLGVALGIGALYVLVISLQLWAMHELKPWILALDGVLFGSVTAFGVGTYNAAQQKARDDLERSREEYRTLTDDALDSAEVATVVSDAEHSIVWTSEATATYFGLDRDSIADRDARTIAEEDFADAVEDPETFRARVLDALDRNAGVEEFECHVLATLDRAERWLKHWSKPIDSGLYEGGRVEHYTDITPVKRRERELDRREASLREMCDIISDASRSYHEQIEGLLDVGRDLFDADYGSFARVDSDAGTYEVETLRAEQADLETGDVVPLAETHCERMLQQAKTLQFGTRPFDVDEKAYGTDRGFETYVGTPVYVDGEIYGSLCFLNRDAATAFDDWELTMVELMSNWMGYELEQEHRREERRKRLHDQASKFEDIVETVDNYAIFTLDADGHVTSWNDGARQIKGYTHDEIVGEHFQTFYPDADVADGLPSRLLAEARETGQARHEGWRVRRDGDRFWADVTIAARHDDDGEHIGYTKIVEDLTEQRERERALQRQRERLEFMNRIIRHNILNGLNLINARTELLESRFADDADAQTHLDTISTRVDDLSDLIDTMRSFMNAILDAEDHDTEALAVRPELEAKIALARQSYDAEFDVHDLPDESEAVLADTLLGEVFENVISNAVVHNDAETPRVGIWTSTTTREVPVGAESGEPVVNRPVRQLDEETAVEERSALVVHVADNGPGIPDDQKAAVLEKGVSELKAPGNGFGLYLVKEMMDTYGGAVDIRDADGDCGTVFDLIFLQPPTDESAR
ncbi:PAS domain S-box-containing protein [Haloplanus vescus]|uniref:histidine kinase n=1 Tax=Haloplanus vescus TaxID=555874 RepID=A0A1H3VQA3_9EURY|nr:PAS domain S-box protein [Haloplanus vescus]SDZ76414.1 PAS domain S-box-containing protein [Haloplanus vescus]